MSSSTVSITGNPTGARLRRHILTNVKKSALNSTTSDSTDASPVTDGETISEKATSHPIKTVTETVQTKITLSTSSTTKLRKRTVDSCSSSSWKTVVSVVVKNLLILIMLLFFVQMICRLAVNQKSGFSFDSVTNPRFEYERRIAEVEEVVMTTSKLMQVQAERLDQKVASEISGLNSELRKQIDEESVGFNNRFGELDLRIKSVERLFSSSHWLSKDEFDRFVEDLKGVGDVGKLKLDEIRAFARGIVEDEIGKHAADGVGRVDYAVASGGGMVLRHSEGFGGRRGGGWFSGSVRSDAVKMLQPSFGQPGECFGFKGDNGFVEIKLRSAIVPEAITLEHVSKSAAFDLSTAPKDCKVWGWSRNKEDTQKEHLLTESTYDLEKSNSQTFNVLLDTEGVNPIIIDTIRLQFISNHGNPTHTCIYRVRVHGHQPDVS